jgi:hypothetical protein
VRESAIGQTVGMPCRGSRMRDEMKDDAAVDGAPVRMQTVGRRTVRPLRKPGGVREREGSWLGSVLAGAGGEKASGTHPFESNHT